MRGWNKKQLKSLNEIRSEKDLVFALCRRLRDNSVYIKDNCIHTSFMQPVEYGTDFLIYVIYKMISSLRG